MGKLSVVLIDDHTLFRTGLNELLLSRGIDVVGMSGNPLEALTLIKNTSPDLALLDLRMQPINGLELLKQIRIELPQQQVVILTTSTEEADLLEALKHGATGYLLKDLEPDVFVEMLHQAHSGETVVAPDLTGLLAKAVIAASTDTQDVATSTYHLTSREMDVLAHIAKGRSNKEIARSLGIVDGTVKLHVRAVLKKLGVKSRVQAAIMAVSENLVEQQTDHHEL